MINKIISRYYDLDFYIEFILKVHYLGLFKIWPWKCVRIIVFVKLTEYSIEIMTGRDKGGKGLGKGSATRHRKVLADILRK